MNLFALLVYQKKIKMSMKTLYQICCQTLLKNCNVYARLFRKALSTNTDKMLFTYPCARKGSPHLFYTHNTLQIKGREHLSLILWQRGECASSNSSCALEKPETPVWRELCMSSRHKVQGWAAHGPVTWTKRKEIYYVLYYRIK